MKVIIRASIAILVLAAIILIMPSCESTYLGRWFAWNFSDIKDYEKFPNRKVSNFGPAFHFASGANDSSLKKISYTFKEREISKMLEDFVEQTETTALIVIKKDTIQIEAYGNGYNRSSINTSFSIAKSITAMMMGVALDEGAIHSVEDPITTYLPELVNSDPKLKSVTLSNLLMMQSGFFYRDHDLVWGDKPKNYYHPCLRNRVLSVKLDEPPGARWQYMGYNPIMCGLILERVTNQTVSHYFQEKIWEKLGMEFEASWSIDSEADQMEKMESGVNARAIDFAKLGRLMLNGGKWNGEQIISTAWVDDCTSLDGSVQAWEGVHYKNFWWIYPANENHPQSFAATGHLGQYIFVSPEEQTIIVRFGKSQGKVDSWIRIFRTLASNTEY